jgi:Ni,Fe-hydrogenase I cytochrome b subunit
MAAFELDVGTGILAAILTLLVTATFIYFAARFVLDRSSFLAAILTAVVGTLLAYLAVIVLTPLVQAAWIPFVAAVAMWALAAAVFFRAKWVQGVIIGIVAWLLFLLVGFLISLIAGNGASA